jgi:uncharacterized protein
MRMAADARELVDEARRHVGTGDYGADKVGRDPVNQAMINHWCQALEDHNPIYRDADFAATTRHGGLVAPPAMLQTWTMDAPGKDDPDGPQSNVLGRLDAAGYTSVVATNYEHEYLRELRLGERITQRSTIEDMSEEKQTGLGDGYFVTTRHDYLDDDGELVGIGRMRLLKFKPPERPAGATKGTANGQGTADRTPRRPRPAINEDNAYFWEGVARGQLLIQRCGGCETLRHPPRPMCDRCQSTEWDTVTASGSGTVYSYVVHHHPPLPGVTTPHPVLLVELAEGVRLVAQAAIGTDPEDVEIGQAVEVVFEQIDEELTVPAFRLTEEAQR